MIARIRAATPQQRKLLLSLAATLSTRAPALIALLFFLPRLRFDLGVERYTQLLAAMALGSFSALLFTGVSAQARRAIGEAHARNDHVAEANAFAIMLRQGIGAALFGALLILAYGLFTRQPPEMMAVAALGTISAYLYFADATRLAYNEHYVSSILVLICQMIFYTVGFTVPAFTHSAFLAAMTLLGWQIAASIIGGALLLRARPHLLRPKDPQRPAGGVRDALSISVADGALGACLSLAVIWLEAIASPNVSAWFGTLARLFTSAISPLILILAPVGGYIRLVWESNTPALQNRIMAATYWLSLIYAVIAVALLYGASQFYLNAAMRLSAPEPRWAILPIFLLFISIIASKGYAMVGYLVLDSRRLANGTIAILIFAVAVAAVGDNLVSPLEALAFASLAMALPMMTFLYAITPRTRG